MTPHRILIIVIGGMAIALGGCIWPYNHEFRPRPSFSYAIEADTSADGDYNFEALVPPAWPEEGFVYEDECSVHRGRHLAKLRTTYPGVEIRASGCASSDPVLTESMRLLNEQYRYEVKLPVGEGADG